MLKVPSGTAFINPCVTFFPPAASFVYERNRQFYENTYESIDWRGHRGGPDCRGLLRLPSACRYDRGRYGQRAISICTDAGPAWGHQPTKGPGKDDPPWLSTNTRTVGERGRNGAARVARYHPRGDDRRNCHPHAGSQGGFAGS